MASLSQAKRPWHDEMGLGKHAAGIMWIPWKAVQWGFDQGTLFMKPWLERLHKLYGVARFQRYRERQREVTDDLFDAALFGDGGHLVQKLVACRYNTQKKEYEIQVQWASLDSLEASWEPATVIYEDVPVLVERLIQASVGDGTAQSM